MGSTAGVFENGVPCVDLTEDPRGLERGTEEWKLLSGRVLEALQSRGWLLVKYDRIPKYLPGEVLRAVEPLFDLPIETKVKNEGKGDYVPYRPYVGRPPTAPLYETLAIPDMGEWESCREFARRMWPEGNDAFCETINSMSSKLTELDRLLQRMIFDSLGVANHYDSVVGELDTLFRMIKYYPPQDQELAVGLPAHRDGNFITVMCQLNDTYGLEVQDFGVGDGQWVPVTPPEGYFVVMVGQALMAWSNGRLRSTLHRVMMTGEKPRFSCGTFSTPKKETIVKAPEELIDSKHPAHFRPFKFLDFVSYSSAHIDHKIEFFAGI